LKIGGTLKYQGTIYYLSLVETKNKISWYLVSELHEKDLATRVTGEPVEFMVLDDRFVRNKPIPVEYVIEALDKAKTSGKTMVHKRKVVLSEVIQALADASAYYFAPELVTQRKEDIQGDMLHYFEARDDRMQFKFTRVNQAHYTELELKYDDIELSLNADWNLRVPTKKLNLFEIKNKGVGKQIFHTTKSLSYDELKNVLDLSWYEAADGTLLKDYRPITSIVEFEKFVMEPLMEEYQACVNRGEKLKLGVDTETTGFIFYDLSADNEELDELVAIPVSWRDNQSVVIFIAMEHFNNVPLDYVIHRFRAFLEVSRGDVEIEKRGNFNKGVRKLEEMHAFGTNSERLDDDDATWEVVGSYPYNRDHVMLIGHNILFDGRVFYHYGVKSEWTHDTLQMAFNLNPKVAKGSNKLKTLTRKIFGHETPELSDILGKGNEDKYKYIQDIRVATLYGCADTDYTRLVYQHLAKLMGEKMLAQYRKQDVDIMNVLYMSEYHGMTADEELLKVRADIVEQDLKVIRKFLYNYVGVAVDARNKRKVLLTELEVGKITPEEFASLESQVKPDKKAEYEFEFKGNAIRRVIYDILEYPKKSWTKDEKKRVPSVDKFAMKKLQTYKWKTPTKNLKEDVYSTDPANEHKPPDKRTKLIEASKFNSMKYPVAYVLAKYAELNKEWTSYYQPLRKQNLEGKIFKGYSLARIETRRIMNPGQTMKGDLKALVKPYNDDYYLCDFDQSQVEYRIMASLSGFKSVIDKMNNPEKDYHTETASQVHNRPAHKVDKYLRKQTKGISFGVPYGLGDHKMSENLFGDASDENLTKTRFMLYDYKKANKPIIDMLDKYKTEAIKPIKLDPATQKFIKVKEEDPDDIPYGKVTGVLGFYRLFDLRDLDSKKKGKIQRPAGNYPIQNFAAELFRMVLMRFYRRCVKEGIADKIIWHMLIHDELLFSVHKSIHPFYLYKLLFESCVVSIEGHTKYFIGINIGNTWADCKYDSNEAPMYFVDETVKRWDKGEFRDDDYQSDVKSYVLRHKQDYITRRIGTVVRELQPNIDTAPVNIPHIMENFTNYTVRSYVADFFKINSPVYNEDEDDIWISKFESWIIDYFGEGKEAIYADGSRRSVRVDNTEFVELDFASESEDEDRVDDEFWDFDEEDIGHSQEELYISYEEEDVDETEEFLSQFDSDNSSAKSVAGLWISKAPAYKNVKIVNEQLVLSVTLGRHIEKIKSFLLDKEDGTGYTVLFNTPIARDRWIKINKGVDLEEIDKFIETLG
jgi:DNA polymerase I-like protein with 3'-5' exonuclease and polymerase domains